MINGLVKVGSNSAAKLVNCCKNTLIELEMAYIDAFETF